VILTWSFREKIENLQSHDNNKNYKKTIKILETYWLEYDDYDQTLLATGASIQSTSQLAE